MKPQRRTWLAAALEQGPAAHGWTEDQRWTLPRIAVLVARRFHVRFSPSQLSRILHEMGFSVQVPVHRAVERDPQAVERWMAEVWPEVEKAVRGQDAWLVFEDEAGQSLRPPKARTWARCGAHPDREGHRQGIRPGLARRTRVHQTRRPTGPADLPDAGPHRSQGREERLP
jgi:putative transposase